MNSLAQQDDLQTCLNWRTLIDLNQGRLPEAKLEAISSHLSECPKCQSILSDWQDSRVEDDFSDRLKRCLQIQCLPDGPELVALESAAIALKGFDTDTFDGNIRTGGDHIDKEIGAYELLEPVGHGGMGIVYRAWQKSVGRLVAVKMIRTGVYATSETIQRFRLEAEAIGRLEHPNVVRLYEFAERDGLPYFAMEWVEGGTLAVRLQENGPLSFREAAELIRVLAATMEFAHRSQVLHRDLKPSNVLLSSTGVPKIADFGIAKLLDVSGNLTYSDGLVGTPSYMAPEQAAGQVKNIGRWTDVYALGTILYETITGKPPYSSDDKIETMRLVREQPLKTPSRLRTDVPADLEAICVKCLEKVPVRRYASAQALADDLSQWLNNQRPQGIPGRLTRTVRTLQRHKLWVAACATLVICTLVVAVILRMRDPDRPLREIQAELAQGRPATLIGETGKPKWYRWKAGEESTKVATATDGAFTLHASDLCLLELLPTVGHDHYRFTIQVRHEKSSMPGSVGVYFAHTAYEGKDSDIQFFTKLSFNDVVSYRDAVPIILGAKGELPRAKNVISMCPHIFQMKGTTPMSWQTPGCAGPNFEPNGEHGAGWRTISVTVAPNEISAEWDGHPLKLDAAELMKGVGGELDYHKPRFQNNRFIQALQPSFAPRGGLGIYLGRGSASFRAATLTPLTNLP